MAPATPAVSASFSTTGTVSNPLDLTPRGEYESVNVNGAKSLVSPKPKVTLTSLTQNNSGTLRKINSVVLPIVYSEKFYKDVLDPQLDDVNKIVYYADIPVGACCSRIEPKGTPTLTILTLAVLAPYRSQGLGAALVKHALKAALHPTAPAAAKPSASAGPSASTRGQLTVAPPHKPINRAQVHVQVGNDSARRFYERLGFKESGVVENYYSKMEPRAAWLLVNSDIAASLGEAALANGA